METCLENWKNVKKASISRRARIEEGEVREGTETSESDFGFH